MLNLAVFLPTRYVSRYSLLGQMREELAGAWTRAGASVNPDGLVQARAALFLFFNFPDNLRQFEQWARLENGRPPDASALIQFFVDHPFALNAAFMDRLTAFPHYRLLLPCPDDAHLLRLRWPNLRHFHCRHGIAREALCDMTSLEVSHMQAPGAGGRDIDILVAGSIHSPDALLRLRQPIPSALASRADDMVRFMLDHPHASFGQAFELCMPTGVFASSQWQFFQTIWHYVTATLNRRRRILLVEALKGLPVTVLGTPAWKDICTGTLRYAGEADYASLPAWLARTRVCLAWGPTQFVHGYSERLLLALGAGCAAACDDRAFVRRDFPSCTRTFDAANPQTARDCIESLLRDRPGALALAHAGREIVERNHLWDHRLEIFLTAINDALRTAQTAAA
jgi:hypothetical protein